MSRMSVIKTQYAMLKKERQNNRLSDEYSSPESPRRDRPNPNT